MRQIVHCPKIICSLYACMFNYNSLGRNLLFRQEKIIKIYGKWCILHSEVDVSI